MKALKLAIPCAAAVLLAGCRTNKDILNDYERDIALGDYGHAAAEVSEKSAEEGVDQLLWKLQAAGANRLAGNSQTAIDQFDAAEDIFIRNDRESVFSQGAAGTCAMMTNDRVFPFAGGGQDRVFTCLYKAIDYASAGNVAAARTELNRADQHQENWLYERRRDIEAAREKLEKDSAAYAQENRSKTGDTDGAVAKAFADDAFAGSVAEKTGFNPETDGNLETLSQKDYCNRYAEDVGKVFRWLADGEDAQNRPKPKNQVWIYVEDGLGPCREEWRLDLPLVFIPFAGRYVMYAGMAIPYLRYRGAGCGGYAVSAGGQDRPLAVLQDMDRLMKVEHDVYLRGALAREITRVIVKVGAQVALGVTCDACRDDYTKIALRASQLSLAAYAASVTQADLRSWTTLPKRVFATQVTRPADGKIVLKGDGVGLVELQVPAGNTMVFVSKPSPAAPPVVREITL